MNTKALWIVLIIVLVAIGAWYAFAKKDATPIENAGTMATNSDSAADAASTEDARTVTVTYTDNGFAPATMTLAVGDTVRFVNESSRSLWVASDAHPTHTEYDGTALSAHCATGGSFDQCAATPTGSVYTFTFSKAGTFDYHNHARATDGGTIVVE
ncbi:MAG TPA: hypothetical protein VFY28_02540 [Candidatus Paceibacterota bacterium]|nr:hypothetical protein [Candidatus Paceibacterota bacterium]